ncbi:MAG: UDP-N-acetylmuramoyl-tripeptide--D-alanyl-D-alanine ligase [Bdellovibrionaceae bacterium]|nr:UDP-N-acetylmuramoyl-tripeptide--D-alanyl-D-alanine ligase [Pseudobdellovibrionaceae bacterium]
MQNELLKLEDVVHWTKGTLILKNSEQFDFIGTDSRVDLTGKLFVPLRGDSFDGHQFIHKAIENGCAGIIYDRKSKASLSLDKSVPVTLIEVEDTLSALQSLAQGYRKKLNKTILAITGSAGKTTAKEFAHQILNFYQPTYASKGSLNNHWGVPFSLLNMRTTDQFGVIEMGMNNYGEIQRLVEIADPDIVVCTMVGRAHFEHFGSQENIARAKFEIYQHSKANTIRIFNIDDPHTRKMRDQFTGRSQIFEFSAEDRDAHVFMRIKKVAAEGLYVEGHILQHFGEALVPVFGQHNITNILAASALAMAAQMKPADIWSRLGYLKTNWGRNQLLKADSGAQVIFDGYNANPDSMLSLVQNISQTPILGKRVLILGEMLELGETRGEFHYDLAKKINELAYDQVIFYGPSWKKFKEAFVGNSKVQVWASEKMDDQLINKLKADYRPGDIIAIKGSRGMKTENAVSLLVQAFSHEKI